MTRFDSHALQREIRSHYDRYPFGFDEDQILDEKLENRIMGKAIQELGDDELVVDVGCGAGRVAQLVHRSSGARTIGLDLSLESLRGARRRIADPLVNGDNLRLPLRSECADLVVSNGVIHHTPDARSSFLELARIVRPGGSMVVSVYRRGWYYYVFRYGGGLIRALRRRIGDEGLRFTVFPFFHVASVILLSISTRRLFRLSRATSWNLFHDQFTTPQCSFHTREELQRWVEQAGLICRQARTEAARQLLTLELEKPLP